MKVLPLLMTVMSTERENVLSTTSGSGETLGLFVETESLL